MSMIYADILPIMKKDGIDDTSDNRWAMLIGVRTAYIKKDPNRDGDYIVIALNKEIDRLSKVNVEWQSWIYPNLDINKEE